MINFYGMEQMMQAKKMELARHNEERSAYQQFKKNKERTNLLKMFKKSFNKRSVKDQIECCPAN